MTAPLTPQEQTYQALRRAMLRAQETGVRIISEAFHVTDPRDRHRPVGVCALGAENYFYDKSDPLALPESGDDFERAYEAIEAGFDGLPPSIPTAWWEVGARLRDEFRPITATALERELEGT